MFFICFPGVSRAQQKHQNCGVGGAEQIAATAFLSSTLRRTHHQKKQKACVSPDTHPLTLLHTAAAQLFDSQGESEALIWATASLTLFMRYPTFQFIPD